MGIFKKTMTKNPITGSTTTTTKSKDMKVKQTKYPQINTGSKSIVEKSKKNIFGQDVVKTTTRNATGKVIGKTKVKFKQSY
jgi:hypothetical protein